MSFDVYKVGMIENMFFNTFHIKPYVFDDSYTLIEMIGQAIEKVNENISQVNSMGQAIVLFEQYVLEQLSTYDQKIIDEVTKVIDERIADGTIANLINQIFNSLSQTINDNKTDIEKKLSDFELENNNKLSQIDKEIADLNYKPPSINLTISPSQLIYNKGETVNSIMLNTPLIIGSDTVVDYSVYKNNNKIYDKTSNINQNEQYLDGNIINNDVSYYVTISDGKNTIQSNTVNINFVYPFYSGVINDIVVNETLIKSLNVTKSLKDNLINTFSPSNQKIVFAYPSSYGNLKSIVDTEIYDIIDGFTLLNITLNINNEQIPYNVYVSNYLIIDTNVTLQFEF
jgi:hypothetical protein